MSKVFVWIKKNGGVPEMEKQAIAKSTLLYNTMEESNGFYSCPIEKDVRSRMNVPFRVGRNGGEEKLEEKFLEEAEKRSMYQLKGHR